MRVAAVVQARMGSTRLPGKVLQPIAGRPLLWHILHRLKKATRLDDIAVATSDSPEDDAVAQYALREGVKVVRGPEDDVLERYRLSANALNPDIIVRIVGDAPLVDPKFIDQLVDAMEQSGSDFIMLKDGVECIHDGIDPFSRKALETLVRDAGNDPVAREHVTGYFKDNQNGIHIHKIDVDPAYQFSGARTSVDTPDDIKFIETLYDRLGAEPGDAELSDVVELLKREPGLLDINNNVKQKRTTSTSGLVIMRLDAGPQIGFGHLTRCLALAKVLRDSEGLGVRFAIAGNPDAQARIKASGFPFDVRPQSEHEADWISDLITAHRASTLVLDIRTRMSRQSVARLRELAPVCVIDDGSDRRFEADLAIYPPVPQVRELEWNGFTGDLVTGWDVVMLAEEPHAHTPKTDTPRVLVSMGGADPRALTVPVVRALMRLDRTQTPFQLTTVIGPALERPDLVEEAVYRLDPKAEVLREPPSLAGALANSDLAILSFGVTAYEAAAAGVPNVSLCLDEDHARSASAFTEANIGQGILVDEANWTKSLSDQVQALLSDPDALAAQGAKATNLVDGKGAARVAARIAGLITARCKAAA